MTEPVLEFADVVRSFRVGGGFWRGRRLQAIRGVNLRLERGNTVALVGESGCGKSTLARIAAGLEVVESGEVRVAGKPVTQRGRQAQRDRSNAVQLIPQDAAAALDPRSTVATSVAEPLAIHRRGTAAERRAKAIELLAEVGLDASLADRYPHELSGGQRQRVVIARALALEPAVLIADEPVSALDVSVRAQVLNVLQRIQRERSLALLLISHDLAVVRGLADRVDVMYLGRIVESGVTDEVIANPLHPYTAALVAAFPDPDPAMRSRLTAPKGDVPSPVDLPLGCSFAGRCPRAADDCRATEPFLEVIAESGGREVACLHPLPRVTLSA